MNRYLLFYFTCLFCLYFTLQCSDLFFKVLAYGRTYVRTDSHVTTEIFQIDGLPNFLRYGAPLARRSSAIMYLYFSIFQIKKFQHAASSKSEFHGTFPREWYLLWTHCVSWAFFSQLVSSFSTSNTETSGTFSRVMSGWLPCPYASIFSSHLRSHCDKLPS